MTETLWDVRNLLAGTMPEERGGERAKECRRGKKNEWKIVRRGQKNREFCLAGVEGSGPELFFFFYLFLSSREGVERNTHTAGKSTGGRVKRKARNKEERMTADWGKDRGKK